MNSAEGIGGIDSRTRESRNSPVADSGHILLIPTNREGQIIVELATTSGTYLTDNARTFGRLISQGFVVVADWHSTAICQLTHQGDQHHRPVLPEHALLVDHRLLLRESLTAVELLLGHQHGTSPCPPSTQSLAHRSQIT